MKFLRNNWFRMGLILFIILSFYMIFWGNDQLSPIQKILMASLMCLPVHQFEEYALPGGGPVVINRAFYGEQTLYRQYPGNWNSIMIVNLSAYIFYILALVFPEAIWLGIATMLFNLFQLLGHAFEMNIKLKTWYNPGLITSVFLFTPISIYYFYYITVNGCADGWDWLFGVGMLLLILVATVILPVQGLKKKDSPYQIPEWPIEQFEKVCSFAAIHK
ncbi:HXXEE domain-containing protein [Butyricicoccus sp.]|uniref:HXXEE domain-containing protein n=1 Tax=Butyricicoccus sp. TaxID=2049021 RepID=UPI003F14EF73